MSNDLGRAFEDKACEYLKKAGYRIKGRNISYRFGELDIVAMEGDVLVFVEVKGGNGYQLPRYRVDERKLRRLEMAVQKYIMSFKPEFSEMRLDVIEVLRSGEITHLKGVGRW
jgi:putative endonuclease